MNPVMDEQSQIEALKRERDEYKAMLDWLEAGSLYVASEKRWHVSGFWIRSDKHLSFLDAIRQEMKK